MILLNVMVNTTIVSERRDQARRVQNILRDSIVSFMLGNKNFDGDAPIINKDKVRKLTVDVSRLMDQNTNGARA
jgi:hypothetical protein